MTRLSLVKLATKQLTEPRSSAPLAHQYVLFKRERLATQDRLYMREMVAATPQNNPEPEPAALQRALFE